MRVRRSVTVILLDDTIEELFEGSVAIGGARVNTDSRIDILAAREYARLEADPCSIALVMILVPDTLRQVL